MDQPTTEPAWTPPYAAYEARPEALAVLVHRLVLRGPRLGPPPHALVPFAEEVVAGPDEALRVTRADLGLAAREVVLLERRRRRLSVPGAGWCETEPGLLRVLLDGAAGLILHAGLVCGYLVACAGLALLTLLLLGAAASGGTLALVGGGVAGGFLFWRCLLPLLEGAAQAALDAARGRSATFARGPTERTTTTWALVGLAVLVPGEVGRALDLLAGGWVAPVASALGWAAFACLLLVSVDRDLGPLGAISALLRVGGGRARLGVLIALAGLLPLPALSLQGSLGLGPWLLVRWGPPVLGLTLVAAAAAQVVAGASDAAARAAVRSARGQRSLLEGAPASWRADVVDLLVGALALPSLLEGWLARRLGDLQAAAPWLEATTGSLRPTFVLVPLGLAVALLLDEARRRRRVDADDQGLLLDPTERWPGERVPWSAVTVRPHPDGVRLVVAGVPAALGPWLPRRTDDPDGAAQARLVVWLGERGARLDG